MPVKVKVKKNSIPPLCDILDMADRAYTDLTRKYYHLGSAYVMALDYYGAAGKKAFKARFPLTDNALRNLELIGRNRLLPQFAMCSNRFTVGLVNLEDSIKWQFNLIGASKTGMVRMRKGDKIVDKKFSDFMAKEENAVLSIIRKSDKKLTPEELSKKLYNMMDEVREEFKKNYKPRPLYKMGDINGTKVVRFYRSKPYTPSELRSILEEMEAGTQSI